MAKRNIGILLAAFLILLGIAGISAFILRQNDPDSGQAALNEDSELQKQLEEAERQSRAILEERGKPTGTASVEIEYAEGFSMEQLAMTIDELNRLNTYKVKLNEDQEDYTDKAAEFLLGNTDRITVDINESWQPDRGDGAYVTYHMQDGSGIEGTLAGLIYQTDDPQEGLQGTDHGEVVERCMEALEIGEWGSNAVTCSAEIVTEEPYSTSDPRYDIRYYIDGYPLSSAVDFSHETDENGYIYSGEIVIDRFYFRDGGLRGIEWTPPREICDPERISLQYESLDSIRIRMEEGMDAFISALGGNYVYVVSDVRCGYVTGYEGTLGENGLREYILVPFLEFEVTEYYYFQNSETWVMSTNHEIGFNLENGSVYVGTIL